MNQFNRNMNLWLRTMKLFNRNINLRLRMMNLYNRSVNLWLRTMNQFNQRFQLILSMYKNDYLIFHIKKSLLNQKGEKFYSLCKNACLFRSVSSFSTWLSSGIQQSTGQTAAH